MHNWRQLMRRAKADFHYYFPCDYGARRRTSRASSKSDLALALTGTSRQLNAAHRDSSYSKDIYLTPTEHEVIPELGFCSAWSLGHATVMTKTPQSGDRQKVREDEEKNISTVLKFDRSFQSIFLPLPSLMIQFTIKLECQFWNEVENKNITGCCI